MRTTEGQLVLKMDKDEKRTKQPSSMPTSDVQQEKANDSMHCGHLQISTLLS
jgi:hypothetical protein